MQFEIITKKGKVIMTFGNKAVISSLSKLTKESKTSFTKFALFGIQFFNVFKKV